MPTRVLWLALSGEPSASRPGQMVAMLQAMESGGMSREGLFEAVTPNPNAEENSSKSNLVGAAYVYTQAGRSAVAICPQSLPQGDREVCQRLLQRQLEFCEDKDVSFVQCILPTDSGPEFDLLIESGFEKLADLIYLACDFEKFPEDPINPPFEMIPAVAGGIERLGKVIRQTYIGSMDCPRLDDRPIAEVIAGYQATGTYRPDLWWIIRDETGDAGCVLINQHGDRGNFEIVYCGLVPRVRGRGWGLELVRAAQWQAAAVFPSQMIAAVDAENEPAMVMYALAGFQGWDRRTALAKFFTRESN
jgi:mycothiol synthase